MQPDSYVHYDSIFAGVVYDITGGGGYAVLFEKGIEVSNREVGGNRREGQILYSL